MQKNAELFDLAIKTENTVSVYSVLDQWLDDVTKNNDKLSLAARSLFDSVADQDTVCEGVKPQEQTKKSSRQTTSSISSQCEHDFLMAKINEKSLETRTSCQATRSAKTRNQNEKKGA